MPETGFGTGRRSPKKERRGAIATRHERLLQGRDFRAIECLRYQVVESAAGALHGRTGKKIPDIADVPGECRKGRHSPNCLERKRSCPEER